MLQPILKNLKKRNLIWPQSTNLSISDIDCPHITDLIKASPVCTDSIVSSVLRVLSFNRLCPIWACLTMIYLQLFPLLLKSTLCFSWLANRIGMAIKKLL